MKVFTSLEEIALEKQKDPVALTIGIFDGVHEGHTSIIKTMKEKVAGKGSLVVVSFSPSPLEHFFPDKSKKHLCSLVTRKKLLKMLGVDFLLLLPFSKDFADLSYNQFLDQLFDKIPFSHLVLGKGATLGKAKEGNEKNVTLWTEKNHCEATYLPLLEVNEKKLSSSLIRSLVERGHLKDVQEILKTPFFLILQMENSTNPSRSFRWNLNNQCLPPDGLYQMSFSPELEPNQKTFFGYVHRGQVTLVFVDYVSLPEQTDFVVYFQKRAKLFPWMSQTDRLFSIETEV